MNFNKEKYLLMFSGGKDSTEFISNRIVNINNLVIFHYNHNIQLKKTIEIYKIFIYLINFNLTFYIDNNNNANLYKNHNSLRKLRYYSAFKIAKKLKINTIITCHTYTDFLETYIIKRKSSSKLFSENLYSIVENNYIYYENYKIKIWRPMLLFKRNDDFTPIIDDKYNYKINCNRALIRKFLQSKSFILPKFILIWSRFCITFNNYFMKLLNLYCNLIDIQRYNLSKIYWFLLFNDLEISKLYLRSIILLIGQKYNARIKISNINVNYLKKNNCNKTFFINSCWCYLVYWNKKYILFIKYIKNR